MVEAAVSEEKFEQSLEFYRRFFFNSCPQQRSDASQGIDDVLVRERGQEADLGIDIMRRSGNIGIADLTYREISMIFAYLDSDTVMSIFNSTKDIKSFKKVYGEGKCKYQNLLLLYSDLCLCYQFASLAFRVLCKIVYQRTFAYHYSEQYNKI